MCTQQRERERERERERRRLDGFLSTERERESVFEAPKAETTVEQQRVKRALN
jgi:hypothetical protein